MAHLGMRMPHPDTTAIMQQASGAQLDQQDLTIPLEAIIFIEMARREALSGLHLQTLSGFFDERSRKKPSRLMYTIWIVLLRAKALIIMRSSFMIVPFWLRLIESLF